MSIFVANMQPILQDEETLTMKLRVFLQLVGTILLKCISLQTYTYHIFVEEHPGPSHRSLAAYCLQLPGKKLHLSALLAAKKFRGRGNKCAALNAFRELEVAGLGTLQSTESRRGTSAVGYILWEN